MESRKESTSSQIDIKTFWRTLSERVTGVTIVTARDEYGPAGLLALSTAHVTADPPTILVSVDKKTSALATILSSWHFAVNYLPAGTDAVADGFSGKAGLSGSNRFVEESWLGKFGQRDKWRFCLTAARMAVEQEKP